MLPPRRIGAALTEGGESTAADGARGGGNGGERARVRGGDAGRARIRRGVRRRAKGRHGTRGWPARGTRFAGGGDACVRRAASRTERGEGEPDRWGPAGGFYFLLFFFWAVTTGGSPIAG